MSDNVDELAPVTGNFHDGYEQDNNNPPIVNSGGAASNEDNLCEDIAPMQPENQ